MNTIPNEFDMIFEEPLLSFKIILPEISMFEGLR